MSMIEDSVTSDDVAVDFTQEAWVIMDQTQRPLQRGDAGEYQNLSSAGEMPLPLLALREENVLDMLRDQQS